GLHDLLQHRHQVVDRRDLLVGDQDVGIIQHRFLAIGVGDEVRRDVALVELHAFGELEFQAEGLAVLDGDHAVLADLLHRLGDHLADGLVVVRRDGGDVGDLVGGLDVAGHRADLFDRLFDRRLDAPLETHRVGTGRHLAQALTDHGLGEDGSGGRAVTGDVVGLVGYLVGELGTHVLPRVVKLDLLGNGDAVVRDGGGSPLLLQNDVATLGAERHLHSVGQLVYAGLEATASLLIEAKIFRCHMCSTPLSVDDGQEVAGRQHQVFGAIQLDLGAGELGVENPGTLLDVHRETVPV